MAHSWLATSMVKGTLMQAITLHGAKTQRVMAKSPLIAGI
jgi:hypothetical protein